MRYLVCLLVVAWLAVPAPASPVVTVEGVPQYKDGEHQVDQVWFLRRGVIRRKIDLGEGRFAFGRCPTPPQPGQPGQPNEPPKFDVPPFESPEEEPEEKAPQDTDPFGVPTWLVIVSLATLVSGVGVGVYVAHNVDDAK